MHILHSLHKYKKMDIILSPEIAEFKKANISYTSLDLFLNKTDEDGTENQYYYETIINKFVNQNIENLEQYTNLSSNKEIIIKFITDLGLLSNTILKTFILLEPCDTFDIIPLPENYNQYNGLRKNNFYKSKQRIVFLLDVIQSYKRNLSFLIEKNDLQTAIFTQKRFVKLFNDCIDLLIKSQFCIDIYKSPLKNDFENVIATFENEININELSLINSLVSKQPEADKPDDVLLKNKYIKIFKNDIGFTLFDKMKGLYSDTNTQQADYSFLFDIMQKDGFVICTGVKFVEFLKDFDITITKIDSSKTGNKQKAKLYKSIKEPLEKKHGLSTI